MAFIVHVWLAQMQTSITQQHSVGKAAYFMAACKQTDSKDPGREMHPIRSHHPDLPLLTRPHLLTSQLAVGSSRSNHFSKSLTFGDFGGTSMYGNPKSFLAMPVGQEI